MTATAQFRSDGSSSGVGGSGVVGALSSENVCIHVKNSCELDESDLCVVSAGNGPYYDGVSGGVNRETRHVPVSHGSGRIAFSVNGDGRGASDFCEYISGEDSRGGPYVPAPAATSGLINVDDDGLARKVSRTSIPSRRNDDQVGGNLGLSSYSGIALVGENDGRLSETQKVEVWGYVGKPSRIHVRVGGGQSGGSGAVCGTDSASDSPRTLSDDGDIVFHQPGQQTPSRGEQSVHPSPLGERDAQSPVMQPGQQIIDSASRGNLLGGRKETSLVVSNGAQQFLSSLNGNAGSFGWRPLPA